MALPLLADSATIEPFQLSQIPARDRDWLEGITARVRKHAFQTAIAMIQAGILIRKVRDRLPYGQFSGWIEEQLSWSRKHTYRLIEVANAFGPFIKLCQTGTGFDATALYLLSQSDVPIGARQCAVELAKERRVTVADAREILARNKKPVPVVKVTVRAQEYTSDDELPEPDEPGEGEERLRLLATVGRPGVDPVAAWGAVEELANITGAFHFSRLDDEEDEPLWSLTVYNDETGPRNFVRRWLSDAFLAAVGREPVKHCRACWTEHPASMFADNVDQPDGRNPICKRCERKRLKKVKAEKRERKKNENQS